MPISKENASNIEIDTPIDTAIQTQIEGDTARIVPISAELESENRENIIDDETAIDDQASYPQAAELASPAEQQSANSDKLPEQNKVNAVLGLKIEQVLIEQEIASSSEETSSHTSSIPAEIAILPIDIRKARRLLVSEKSSHLKIRERIDTNIPPERRRKMRRYIRRSLYQRQQREHIQGLSSIMLIILLVSMLGPILVSALLGLQIYNTYETLHTHATSGIQHFMDLKTILSQKNANGSMLDANKLQQATQSLEAARKDFVQVKAVLDQSNLIQIASQILPQYITQLTTARAGSQIGIDISDIGLHALALGQILAPRLNGSLLGDSGSPLLLPDDLPHIHSTLDAIQPFIDDIQQQSTHISLNNLPISTHQQQQLQGALQMLPSAINAVKLAHTWLDPLAWLIGVDGARTFLVETMDRGELRATGGFSGQYGELHIQGGRMAPLTLQNVALLEYNADSVNNGQLAPEAYRSWWPFANWGLRDANLSADFPTSARLIMQQYEHEVNHPLDGVIMFSPFLIQHVIQAIGSVSVPAYNEIITAQNLEERLHFYQLDHDGIVKEKAIEHVDTDEEARKQFTSRLAKALMAQARKASPTTLLALGQQMLADSQTHDLEFYSANQQLEDLLSSNGYATQVDRSNQHDGLYIVQTNVSASKASQYIRTQIHDTVMLDANRGALHYLQLRLAYTQIGDVYGLDTYRDYLRIYLPASAQFRNGTGFDNGIPLCSGPLAACPDTSVYPHDELLCPTGEYHGGASAPMLNDPYYHQYHPLDEIGGPTNMQSDESERAMYAGYVIIPKNCTMTISLSWYVPSSGNSGYTLLFQHQAATFPELDLTILPTPSECNSYIASGLYFNGVMENDRTFSLKQKVHTSNTPHTCTVQQP